MSRSGGRPIDAEHLPLGAPTRGRSAPQRRHVDPGAIARRLGAVVQWTGSVNVPDRSWRLIAQTRDDAWLIAWPGGSAAELHDHGGSRGALHVIDGALVETIPWRGYRGSVSLARRVVHQGATLAFGAGHVHDVRNEGAEHAFSVHVYSPPLTSMIYYDRLGDRVVPREGNWVPSLDRVSSLDRSPLSLLAP